MEQKKRYEKPCLILRKLEPINILECIYEVYWDDWQEESVSDIGRTTVGPFLRMLNQCMDVKYDLAELHQLLYQRYLTAESERMFVERVMPVIGVGESMVL